MKRFLLIFSLLFLILSLLSCRRIPLRDPDGNVLLELELKLQMDVSVSADMDLDAYPELKEKIEGKKPEWISVCFYDAQTHQLVAQDFISANGGFINIAPGTYDVIIYNLGDESTQVTGTETRGGAYAFTSQEGTRVKVTKGSKGEEVMQEYDVVYEPDHLLVGTMESLVIPEESERDHSVTINALLQSAMETYTFEISTVTGGEHIARADVFITDQSAGRYLWDGRFVTRPCAMRVPAVVDRDKGVLYTVFNTFGKFPDPSSEVFLSVQVTGEHGGMYQWTYDVTEQITNPDNTGNALVVTEPMDVPEDTPASGGGFNPNVEDWNHVVIEIPLN